MGWRKFPDRPSPVQQRIHDDDETQQWSAVISSWTEDGHLQASVPTTPLWWKNNRCSASGETQNTTKKLVLQDAEIVEICKHARATTGEPHQELVHEQSALRAGDKVGITPLKDKIFIHMARAQICPTVGLGKGSVLLTWETHLLLTVKGRGEAWEQEQGRVRKQKCCRDGNLL